MSLAADNLPLQAYLSYIELLAQWNKAYNLTAKCTPEIMLAYHVLDSLAILPFIQRMSPDKCLDIGTGAGLPGIILALAMPDTQWVLLDSSNKKLRFVRHIVLELGINNVEIICSRIEHYQPDDNFVVITVRALGSLAKIFNYAHRLLAPQGKLLAMKGTEPEKEIAALQKQLSAKETTITAEVIPLKVLGVNSARNLVEIKK